MRPRLLDLFCREGGAGTGYDRAGFDVTGVDLRPQGRYPFTFIRADALEVLADLPFLGGFAAVHASPPCPGYSLHMRGLAGVHPKLIGPVRDRLTAAGVAWWVIENVPGAPLAVASDLFGAHGVELCGTMFGQRIWRHRLFETSFPLAAPRGCDHSRPPMNPFWGPTWKQWQETLGPGVAPERAWREELGVGWMTQRAARDAVPPAMTEYIGRQLQAHLAGARHP